MYAAVTDLTAARDVQSLLIRNKFVLYAAKLLFVTISREREVSRRTVVHTVELRQTLLDSCSSRNDSFSLEVKGCLNMCSHLVAVEAINHTTCYVLFVQGQ